jgi:hypothetical protein
MTETGRARTAKRDDTDPLPQVVTSLMKGPIYRDEREQIWRQLVHVHRRADEYVATMGLAVLIDETKGYAFLRSRFDTDDDAAPPRLIPRRALSYPVSLILALLRRRLAEFDASSSDSRLIISRQEIVDLVRVFLPSDSNEARIIDRIDAHLGRVGELGFVRELPGQDGQYEVRRILEAFVDAQWLAEFDQRLAEYAEIAGTEQP